MSDIEKRESPESGEFPEILDSKDNHQSLEDDASKEARVAESAAELGVNTKRLQWKIDLAVVPPFCLLYFLSFLDRVNIGNAKLYGLSEDLNLKGNEYNTALTLFFVPYIFFELFSNYIIKMVRPRYWLAGCILLFGVISIGMGFSKNFGALAACRFLIGVTEASTFPGIFYILSTYYTKYEAQRRFSAFFSVTTLAGAASGSIAWRINELDGVHGIASWQWIFIIEGAFTAGLAFVLLVIIPDFPEESRFLNDAERSYLKQKLAIVNGSESAHEIKFTPRDVLVVLKDYMVWIPTLAYFFLIIGAYSYAYFSATIVAQMGYTAQLAQAHSVYPWLVAFGLCNITAFALDRVKMRYPFIIVASIIAVVGLAMVLGAPNDAQVRYGGCFLAAAGLYTAMPQLVCWSSLSFGNHIRKSVGTAVLIGGGNIGGIIATFLFLQKDAPLYKTGLGVCIAMTAACIFAATAMVLVFRYQNRKKLTPEFQARFDELPERDQLMAGDRGPNFKYMY